MKTEIRGLENMGTLKELINYIQSKSGVQSILVTYNNELIFDGSTNHPDLSFFYEKRVIKFNWIFKSSKISCVIADELP